MRRNARIAAMQAIYQWQFTGHSIDDILLQFYDEHDMTSLDQAYFQEMVKGVLQSVTGVDEKFKPLLDRDIDDLNPVELAILRLATFEFMQRLDIPYRVVINEALELAKSYGSEQGHKYVNAILDKLALELRAVEMSNQ